MDQKVLSTIKTMLDLTDSIAGFDEQIIIFINESVLNLKMLGALDFDTNIGVSEETKWDDLLIKEGFLNSAKTYIFLSVRLVFDPPTNTNYKSILESKRKELEERFSMYEEVPIDPIEEEE